MNKKNALQLTNLRYIAEVGKKKKKKNLGGFATASLTNENESLAFAECLQELMFLVPNRECLPLLKNLEVPLGERSLSPAIDEIVVVVGGAAIGFRHLSGTVVNHVEQAHLPLSLCAHRKP